MLMSWERCKKKVEGLMMKTNISVYFKKNVRNKLSVNTVCKLYTNYTVVLGEKKENTDVSRSLLTSTV